MGKNAGAQETNTANTAYQQEIQNANTLFGYLQQNYPQIAAQLQNFGSTLNGNTSSPLMQAAQAPVRAATNSQLNTIQSNAGGVANPAALYEGISLNGQQNAALAADQTLATAGNGFSNLASLLFGGAGTGQSSLNAAAGGEANLGAQLNQNANAPWEALLGAAGEYFGAQAVKTGSTAVTPNPNVIPSSFNALSSATQTPFGTTGIGGSSGPISQAALTNQPGFGMGWLGGLP